jgi:putative colanic acid biosysnthesis UDP-glucose lipid carrier transferase
MNNGRNLPDFKSQMKNKSRSFRGVIRGHYHDFATLLRLADSVIVAASLWALLWIYGYSWNYSYAAAAVLSSVLFFIIAQFLDIYRTRRGSSIVYEFMQLCTAWFVVVFLVLLAGFATKISDDFSRLTILTWVLLTPGILASWRAMINYMLGVLRKNGINVQRVAIVGARDLGAEFAQTLLDSRWMGLNPVGFYDDRKLDGERPLVTEPLDVIGDLDLLVNHAEAGKIDTIYITLPLRAEERIRKLLERLADSTVSVYLVPDFFGYNLINAAMSNLGEYPVVSIYETPFNGIDGWIKRCEDIVLSSLILLLISMPMLMIAIGVKLSSPGPVIFKQVRYGLRGERIDVLKFRTMTVCEDNDSVQQAQQSDPRVTPFGAFLRRYSLDELPQFFNVLQGSMSIVGPRPHAVIHNEQYRKLISGYMLRHKVKPGITGLAQINGWRGETDTLDKMKNRVDFDLAYIKNWSLLLDIKIIFLSLLKGFTGKNAY